MIYAIMKIVVIDSIINREFFQHKEKIKCYKVKNKHVYEDFESAVGLSHGTLCSLIIEKYGFYDQIIGIKVLNSKGQGDIDDLIIALKWCLNKNIDIINLSLGSVEHNDFNKIKKICDKLSLEGKIIVAAKSNDDQFTAPACFDSVIGVKCFKKNNLKKLRNIKYASDGINYEARGSHCIKLKDGGCIQTEKCNSFACAYVTSVFSRKKKE